MKKVLLFLLLSGFSFGQNIEKLCNLNFEQSKEIADEIGVITDSRIKDIADREQYRAVLFEMVPNSFSEEDYKKYKNGDLQCDGCFKVIFSYIMKGQNKDLEIKGIKTYSFSEYTSKFLNVLPFWQKYFRPDVNQDNYTDVNNREYRGANKQLAAMLYDQHNGRWQIKKTRCN